MVVLTHIKNKKLMGCTNEKALSATVPERAIIPIEPFSRNGARTDIQREMSQDEIGAQQRDESIIMKKAPTRQKVDVQELKRIVKGAETQIVADAECSSINTDKYTDLSDLVFLCLKGDDFNVLKTINACLKFKFTSATSLNAVFCPQELIDKLKDKNISKSWTPVHFACYYNQTTLLRYFLEQRKESLLLAYSDPEWLTRDAFHNGNSTEQEIEMIRHLITKRALPTFSYLINNFQYASHYLSYRHIKQIINWVHKAQWIEGLQEIVSGSTLKNIFRSFTVKGKLQIIQEIFEPLLANENLRKAPITYAPVNQQIQQQQPLILGALVHELLNQQPYISVTYVNILKGVYDPYMEKQLTPTEKTQRLRSIKANLYSSDVIKMAIELKFNVALEEYFKEINSSAQQYDKAAFQDLVKHLKTILTIENINRHKQKINGLLSQSRLGTNQTFDINISAVESRSLERFRATQNVQLDFLKSPKHQVSVNTSFWGPLLWCLQSQNYSLFQHLLAKYNPNLRKELFLDLDDDFGEETSSYSNELLPFVIVVDQQSTEGLLILLESPLINHLWRIDTHIKEAVDMMRYEGWTEGIQILLQAQIVRTSFNALAFNDDERSDILFGLHIPITDSYKELMLKSNLTLAQDPIFSLDLMVMLITNYDFLTTSIQQALHTIAKQCNQSISKDRSTLTKWICQRAMQAVNLVSVKEFMVGGLDESVTIQKRLKEEFMLFFSIIREIPGFAEAEKLADEGPMAFSTKGILEGSTQITKSQPHKGTDLLNRTTSNKI
ncbi:hypothetical protein FGO68_gene9238 [Halteria grandinella]|uniref:Uncharacterized protein n=1 Tax=Halteria grandinella TaxID=5974 RepID=A0A8J8T557_HALGN|nr:hypothetical protein FGO68_gene9238 [Halteria grandinella]